MKRDLIHSKLAQLEKITAKRMNRLEAIKNYKLFMCHELTHSKWSDTTLQTMRFQCLTEVFRLKHSDLSAISNNTTSYRINALPYNESLTTIK